MSVPVLVVVPMVLTPVAGFVAGFVAFRRLLPRHPLFGPRRHSGCASREVRGDVYCGPAASAEDGAVTAEQPRPAGRNDLLRQARLRAPSPRDPTRPMSQRELAEAVTAHVFRTTTRVVPVDRHYISRLERGERRWPIADYRSAFRAILEARTDAELGFYIKRRPSGPHRASAFAYTTRKPR